MAKLSKAELAKQYGDPKKITRGDFIALAKKKKKNGSKTANNKKKVTTRELSGTRDED